MGSREPWYKESFGRDYLALYPHRDESEARCDIADLVALIDPPRGEPLLDLCCGAGRHLVALCDRGFRDLTGLDLSADLLDVARERLSGRTDCRIRWIRADMRHIPFADHFQTVLSLFTSFGYFPESSEDEAALRSVFSALRPGGAFCLDTLDRDHTLAHLVEHEEKRIDGRTLAITRRVSADGLRVEKRTRILSAPQAEFRESVRMYTSEELHDMLERSGFVDLRLYGSLGGEPHSSGSSRMIAVARKARP
jgi:SAM-dependent methyltransferase